MPRLPIAMFAIKEILRLHHDAGHTQREISRATGVSQSAIQRLLRRASQAGLGWPLTQPAASDADPADTLVLAYLERYGTGLCGHPVVRDPGGQAIAIVARTNNILEQHFATSKQALRRRLGCAHLGRDLADQPAQAALTANLLDPAYVQILCGSLDQLPHAFAALESPAAANPPRLERNNRDAALRRRNRAWADDTIQTPAPVTSSALPNAPRTATF